jgi:hypothetical protein
MILFWFDLILNLSFSNSLSKMRTLVYISSLLLLGTFTQPADSFRPHFNCVMDAVKFSGSIAVCLAESVVNHKACISKLDNAQAFLQDCCNSFENSTSNIGMNIKYACPYFTGGAGEP